MFRWIFMIGFAVIMAGILLHALLFSCRTKSQCPSGTVPEQKLKLLAMLKKLAFVVGLFSFIGLLVTGFGPLLLGGRLQGYWLMVHATFAPVFIGCAAVIGVMSAGQYRFNQKDAKSICWTWKPDRSQGCWLTDNGIGVKAGFWFLLLMTLPLTLSMVFSMFPVFGTAGQEFLFYMHRWCGLVFAWGAIVELYMLIRMAILKKRCGIVHNQAE